MSDWADQLGQPAGTPESSGDDWADSLTATKSNEARTLDANLMVPTTPDRSAKVLDLHKRTGLPINLVDSQLETVEQEAKKTDFDTEKFTKENPVVSKWMSENPQQASLGVEDRANLSATEKMLRVLSPVYGIKKAFEEDRVQPYIEQTSRSLGASVFRMGGASAGLFRAAAELRYLPAEIAAHLSGLPPETGRKIYDVMEGGATKDVAGFLGEQQQIAEDWAKYIRGDLSKFTTTEQAVFSGVESAGQNIVNLAAGIITKNPQIVLSLMSSQTAGEAYGQAREKDVSVGKSLLFSTAQGTVEYATELLPMMKLMKDLGLKTSFVRTLVNQAPSEIVGEQVATVLQDFNEWATLNPEAPFSDYADARGDAAYQTLVATITAMIGLTGAGHVVSRAVNYREARQQEDFFRALGEVSKNTKLRERLPEQYRELVDTLTKDGPVENVYTPIEFFQSHFQTDQVDAREVAVELGIEKAYDEAVETGSKLAIPTSVYASKIAPTEHNTAFVKELAIAADGLTAREAEELQKEFEQTKTKEPDVFEQSVQKVREDVQKQLEAIMPSDVAEPQAALWEARYRARAERLGVDPWTLYQQQTKTFTSEVDRDGVSVEHVARGTTPTEEIQARIDVSVRESNAKAWAEKLPDMPRSLYEKLAQISPDVIGPEDERKLQELRQRISETGETPEAAMREMWGPELADAPRGLQKATGREVVLSQASLGTPQVTRLAGNLNQGPALTLTPNTVPGEGPYRVTHWLDGQPVRHEAFADLTQARKSFQAALNETNKTAEQLGEKPLELFQAARRKGPVTRTKAFKQWFGKSKVVNEEGKPLVVYHGTTHDFDVFTTEKATVESDFGAGYYFSNNTEDVSENYAGEGPDLTQRIELRAERIFQELADELEEQPQYGSPVHKRLMNKARKMAREELSGGAPNVIPVYLSFQNPLIIGGDNETKFDMELQYDIESVIDQAREEIRSDNTEDGELTIDETELEELAQERARELSDENGYTEYGGSLLDFTESLAQVASRFNDTDKIVDTISYIQGREDIEAEELVELLKQSEGIIYATDEEGNLSSGELIRQAFEHAGYDGIIDNSVNRKFGSEKRVGRPMAGMDYGTVHYIAFKPEQIKSAIGNRGTFDPNDQNILYQSAAQQPQLSVLHNLSSENLEFADKIGGLAVPSLAVVKEGMGLEGYGDVTLIGRKELADPKQTEVFDADAYTSTFPRPEYRKVKSKVAQKFVDALRPWTNAFEEAGVFSEAWDNAVNRPKPWDTISSFERSKAAKAWFLSEQGINVKPVRQHAERRYRWADDKEFREVFHPLFSDIWAETSKVDRGEALMRIGDAARKAIDKYLAGDSREAKAYGQIYTESNEARQVLASSFGIDGSWLTDGESMPLTIADRISDDLKREGQMVVNRSATDKKINKALVGKEADFKQWVEDKILPMYGDPFLTLGRKKVEYNLENIVTYMTRGGVHAQEETMTFGEGKARAVAATRITSFQEMRNRAEWQITERENVDEIREKAKKAMSEWRDKVVDYYGEKSSRDFGRVWEGLDASMRAISKWAKGRGFAEALRSEGFKSVPDYVIEQGKEAGNLFMQAPVPYFEAKPERAVKLEEFAGAVIPEDSSDKVKAILAKHKIPFKTYPVRFDEVARTAVVNQFRNELTEKGENVLFQKERGVTRFTDRTVNIELFKNADLSTLLHESSHVFLLEMHDDVQYLRSQEKLSAKQQGIIDDFNNLLKWFGITEQELLEQTTVDGKTTLSPKSVKANEQFARGMEAYLAEGKAPSSELRSAFQRFKAWLTHVYRLWKNDPKVALNVHLNDEVRGIMDRLLATDEQIRQAQAESEIKAVFTDATMAGMSDTEFIAYQKTLEDANEESKQNLEQQLMREFQRERTKWWKEERAKIRAEIEADVDQRPIYRALAELKREGGPRLDRKAITERFKDRVKQLPTGVAVKEGGIDPDTAAEMLGFKSGEDLINQLSTMQNRNKLIDAETDQRMVQEHGNMLLDGSIFEKAREAVRDEKRSEIILRELKALQKKAREVKPFVEAAKKEGEEQKKAGKQIYLAAIPTVAQARETAQRTIAGTRIRDLRPMQYFAAARKASKSAIEAVNKGDFVLAAVLKRQEMIANEMYRAAVKAQAEVKKILDYLKKFDKKSTRERIGKAEGGFLDQIDALIARYNLHPQTKAVLAKKKAALREWYDAQVALGFEPTIDPDLMDESRRTNYKDVPLEDLQALQDAVKSIEYIASRIGKMKTIMGEKEYNDVVDLLVGKAEETLAKVPKPKEQILKSWLDRKKDMLKGHDVDLVSMETLIEILDGGAVGPWHDIVFNPASEAQSAEYDMAAEYGDVVGKIIDEYVEQDTSRILDMFQTDLQEEPMSRYKLLSIAFNIGNESNMEKMAKGHEWTEAQILEAVKKLDAKDLAFVQKIWDTLDTFYPKLNELQKKVSGVELARVQPRAVYLTLNDGSKVDLKGGYYPASYDPDFSMQGQKQDTGPLAGLTEQGYARATAPDSFRKTRTKFAAPMRLDFGYVLQKHLAGVMKDLSHREFLIDMNRLLRDKRIRKVIQERLGREYEQMFVPWLRGIANDRNVSPADMTGWDKRFEMARSHVTVVALGFKVTSILAQIAGLPNALEYVSDQYGSRYMATALNDFIRSPFDSLDMVRQKSGEMRHRFETIDREVRDELRRMQSAHPIRGLSKLMLAKEMFERAAFYGINFMDRVVAVPTWMAAYQGAKDQMIKDSPGMDSALMEKRAIHAGDAAVRRTQGAGGAKDLSAIQRKRGVMKILTMFYTPFAAWYGRLRTIGGRMARSNNRWRYTPEAIMHVALITMIPTIMAELLAGRGPEDCKNKEGGDYAACFGRWAAIKAGFSLAAPIPVIRDIANGLENYAMDGRPRDTRFSPVLDAINRVATTTRRAGSVMFGDKPLEDDLVFDIFETSGYFMGFPTAQPRVTLEYLYDLMTDEAKAETPLEFLSGLAYRRKPDRTR